jgi:hypothetical protein
VDELSRQLLPGGDLVDTPALGARLGDVAGCGQAVCVVVVGQHRLHESQVLKPLNGLFDVAELFALRTQRTQFVPNCV